MFVRDIWHVLPNGQHPFHWNGILPFASAQSANRRLILSPLCVRRMLSAMVGLMSIVTNLEQTLVRSPCGIELVTTSCSSGSSEIFVRFVSASKPRCEDSRLRALRRGMRDGAYHEI